MIKWLWMILIGVECNGRCLEFFEGDNNRFSMARLLMFLSFFPSSYVVIICADKPNIADILFVYIGGFVLGYVGGKGMDTWKAKKAEKQDDKEES